jgi:hypothetical protein
MGSDRIREVNDLLRRTSIGRRVMITIGVDPLNDEDKEAVIAKVRWFDQFEPDDYPHGEHDFGSFEHSGVKYFFKMDYYAPDMASGSEDPSDPAKTRRVFTIMRADGY